MTAAQVTADDFDRLPSSDDSDSDDDDGCTDFQQYRDELLSRVPDNVKSRFLEGGFCKWGKEYLPVLEVGPFDVEPGPVRGMWMEMFEKVS